jgi:hypothetical protein
MVEEIDWEKCIKMQICEMRSRTSDDFIAETMSHLADRKRTRITRSRPLTKELVMQMVNNVNCPVICWDEEWCPEPILIGIKILHPMRRITIIRNIDDLSEGLSKMASRMLEELGSEQPRSAMDMLLEGGKAVILLPADVLHARKVGWEVLMREVASGERSSNRDEVNELKWKVLRKPEQREAMRTIRNADREARDEANIDWLHTTRSADRPEDESV